MNREPTPRLWVDVEDLFQYGASHARISGIQRVIFELCNALQSHPTAAARLGYLRHDATKGEYLEIPWQSVTALVTKLSASTGPTAKRHNFDPPPPPGGIKGIIARAVTALPPELERPVSAILRTNFAAVRSWTQLARGVGAFIRRRRRSKIEGTAAPIRPRDMLLLLGLPWALPDHIGWIDAATERYGLRVSLLVYDLIQIRFEEFFGVTAVEQFGSWIDAILPRCDALFAISHATVADTEARLRELGMTDAPKVLALPMGTGFTPVTPVSSPALPPPGTYALIVGTIEARKNHLVAFRAWRHLLTTMPPELVPSLVFAGRPTDTVADLMQQIANTRSLHGKLVIIQDASDAEITALYEGCLFTLFPSYAEGWGLPVSESLAFGKPCFAADRTSLPEAGMGLARLFDPDNLPELLSQLRHVLTDPDELAAWTAKVRAEFRPVPWSATAQALLDGLSGG